MKVVFHTATISASMSTKFEVTEQNPPDACIPAHLSSPTPELAGIKRLTFKIGRHLRYNLPDWCLPKGKHFVKRGPFLRLQEALTMDFIARNTTICVPRVIDVFSYNGIIHIVQERIDGHVLEDIWRELSSKEQHSCMMQIKAYMGQMRVLKPPHPERVQAVDGSSLMDGRFGDDPWGPFDNHGELHRFLHHDFFRRNGDKYSDVAEALLKVEGKKYRTVFCHGDFGPHNLMWRARDGKLFVIDWEMAGWFPEYWDFARANIARGHLDDWWDMFKETVDRYDDEAEVQSRIWSYFW